MSFQQSTRIGESFHVINDNALPQYPATIGDIKARPSGQSTLDTNAPVLAVDIGMNHWIVPGLSLVTPIAHLLNNEYLPLKEQAMHHSCEADVVRAAALHLIHPISQALSASPQIGGMIRCQSELKAHQVRSDVVFSKNRAGGGFRTFAVVEFKKRGLILDHEFRAAEKVFTTKASLDNLIAASYNLPKDPRSYFQGNSRVLMKQAASYAIQHDTKYVALFNWDFLILIRFSGPRDGLSLAARIGEGVGTVCETTVIPYTPNSNAMRAALLGFLAEAHAKTRP